MKKLFLIPLSVIALTGCTLFPSISASLDSNTTIEPSVTDPTDSNIPTGPIVTQPDPSVSQPSIDVDDSTSTGTEVPPEPTRNPALISSQEYYNFFNGSDVKLNINFHNGALSAIEQCGVNGGRYEDLYFPADVTITVDGKSYSYNDVGFRRKGNTSKGDDFSNGRIHYKMSFVADFDDPLYLEQHSQFHVDWTSNPTGKEERKNRTFLDMEKLDLKWNRNQDPNKLRQAFTMETYRNMNTIAARDTIGNITVMENNSTRFTETYEIFEVIDQVLVDRYFTVSENDGDLYKLRYIGNGKADFLYNNVMNNNLVGVDGDGSGNEYPYELKTNKSKSNHEQLYNFVNVINTKGAGVDFEDELSSILDLEYFANFAAASYVTGDPDDLRSHYNNTYVYFSSLTNKAYFIPYDKDRSCGIINGGAGMMPARAPTSTKNSGYSGGNWQDNPIWWRTTILNTTQHIGPDYSYVPQAMAHYRDAIKNIYDASFMTPTAFNSFLNKYNHRNDLGDANSEGGGNASYQNFYNQYRQQIQNDTNLLNFTY